MLSIKRIYEPYMPQDGYRILVDRLWPRGISKEQAHVDKWLKEVSPSDALRKWYNHDPAKWDAFRKKYRAEIKDSEALSELLADLSRNPVVTFLFSSKNETLNNAIALKEIVASLR